VKDLRRLGINLVDMGYLYFELEDLKKVEEILKQVFFYVKKVNIPDLTLWYQNLSTELFLKKKNLKKAENFLKLSEKVLKKFNIEKEKARFLVTKSKFLAAKGDFQTAINEIKEGMKIYQKIKDNFSFYKSYIVLLTYLSQKDKKLFSEKDFKKIKKYFKSIDNKFFITKIESLEKELL
ncbi:MAG: hypothetical protein ABIM64_02565, partial [candidate division WOR-3 bacterium]